MSSTALSRRRFLQVSALTLAGAAAAACAPAATPGAEPGAAPSTQPTVVSFMSLGGEHDQMMFQEALALAEEQPALMDRGIVTEWFPDPGGGWDKFMAMYASDTAYDVQRMDDDRVAELALNNKIHQLDCLMDLHGMKVDDYYPLFWQTLNLGGFQYSMNPLGGANAVYYNIDLFEEAGVEAPTSWADAWEWDEFLEMAEKLSKKDANGRPTQYALGFENNVVSPIAYGAGAAYMDESQTECRMNDPAAVAAIDAFAQITVPGGPEYISPPGLERPEMFNSGKLAMIWLDSNFMANISQDINWEIMPWMKTPITAHTENYDRTFVISKTAPDHEAAFLVMKTLCEEPVMDVFTRGGFGVPYLKSAAEGSFAEQPKPINKQIWLETFDIIDGVRIDIPTPRGPAGLFKNNFANATGFEDVLTGLNTAQQFMDETCAKSEQDVAPWEWEAGQMEARLIEAGAVTCENTKMWPDTDWP